MKHNEACVMNVRRTGWDSDRSGTDFPGFCQVFDQPANAYSGMETSCVG